jgi:hypothetical protein
MGACAGVRACASASSLSLGDGLAWGLAVVGICIVAPRGAWAAAELAGVGARAAVPVVVPGAAAGGWLGLAGPLDITEALCGLALGGEGACGGSEEGAAGLNAGPDMELGAGPPDKKRVASAGGRAAIIRSSERLPTGAGLGIGTVPPIAPCAR